MQPKILDIPPEAAFIISDFDGTLSPIVSNPPEAVFEVDAIKALIDLSFLFKTVGILSGRTRDFILSKAKDHPDLTEQFTDRIKIIGLYGNENLVNDTEVVALVASLTEELVLTFPPPIFVENKIISVTVHYRNCPEEKSAIEEKLGEILLDHPDLSFVDAKKSFEVIPKSFKKKGDFISELLSWHEGGYYFGDDLGDLDAFRILNARSDKSTCSIAVKSKDTPKEVIDEADFVVDSTKDAIKCLRFLAAGPIG